MLLGLVNNIHFQIVKLDWASAPIQEAFIFEKVHFLDPNLFGLTKIFLMVYFLVSPTIHPIDHDKVLSDQWIPLTLPLMVGLTLPRYRVNNKYCLVFL